MDSHTEHLFKQFLQNSSQADMNNQNMHRQLMELLSKNHKELIETIKDQDPGSWIMMYAGQIIEAINNMSKKA